ncbi:pectinesterase family protein [Streptomyces sp. NPDC002143]
MGQAVALLAQGDRQVYDNVRLLGNQDTLYTKQVNYGGALSRQYFTNSYIAGDVDFVFGHGTPEHRRGRRQHRSQRQPAAADGRERGHLHRRRLPDRHGRVGSAGQLNT